LRVRSAMILELDRSLRIIRFPSRRMSRPPMKPYRLYNAERGARHDHRNHFYLFQKLWREYNTIRASGLLSIFSGSCCQAQQQQQQQKQQQPIWGGFLLLLI